MTRFRSVLLSLLLMVALVGCGAAPKEETAVPAAVAIEATAPAASATRPASATPLARTVPTLPTRTASATRSATRTPTATDVPSATPLPPTSTVAPTTVPPTATVIPPTAAVAPPTAAAVAPTTPPAPAASSEVGQPVRLIIPSLGVDAAIEVVAEDSQGRMDVPKGVMNVAWYQPGVRPGEIGNAVFSGHLDDYKQQPAVFWRLNELQSGDTVIVRDANGVERTFAVTDKEVYPYDEAPLAKIFGADFNAGLNLITCNGIWDSHEWNYDKRLVVYTRLIQ